MTEFEDILDSQRNYMPPEVLLEMRHSGPFSLHTEGRDFSFQTHKMTMFPMFTVRHKGFAVAVVADEYETTEEFKRTGETGDVHQTLESVVEFLVDEFTLGAEEFIFAIAKRLGLKPVEQLRLAA